MTRRDGLDRWYAALLRAYPRWYRRERGVEIVTTLLDAAPPGRRRPTGRDIFDLVGGGLRCRLRPPRGIPPRLTAVVVALFAATAAAAGASLLSSYPGPPSEADAVAAYAVATGRQPADVPGPAVRCASYGCDAGLPAGDPVVAYQAELDHTDFVGIQERPIPGQPATLVEQARARLVAAGWHAGPVEVQVDGWPTPADCPDCSPPGRWHSFTATNGALSISFTGRVDRDTGNDPSFQASVSKRLTAGAVLTVAFGAVAGLATGWLLAVWTLQRHRRQAPRIRVAMAVTAVPVLSVGLFTVLTTGWLGIALLVLEGDRSAKQLMIPAFVLTAFPLLPIVAGVAAVATMVLAALPRPPGRVAHAAGAATALDLP